MHDVTMGAAERHYLGEQLVLPFSGNIAEAGDFSMKDTSHEAKAAIMEALRNLGEETIIGDIPDHIVHIVEEIRSANDRSEILAIRKKHENEINEYDSRIIMEVIYSRDQEMHISPEKEIQNHEHTQEIAELITKIKGESILEYISLFLNHNSRERFHLGVNLEDILEQLKHGDDTSLLEEAQTALDMWIKYNNFYNIANDEAEHEQKMREKRMAEEREEDREEQEIAVNRRAPKRKKAG